MNQTIIFNASDIETVQPTVSNPVSVKSSRRKRKQCVSDLPDEIRYCVPFAGWMDRHPVLTNALLILMAIALAWVIFTYEFTIPAYK